MGLFGVYRPRSAELKIEGDGEPVVLMITALSQKMADDVNAKRKDGEYGWWVTYWLWRSVLPAHPEATLEELYEHVPVRQTVEIQRALEALNMPEGAVPERGVVECPGCKMRFPFEREGESVVVREDVANFESGGEQSPT